MMPTEGTDLTIQPIQSSAALPTSNMKAEAIIISNMCGNIRCLEYYHVLCTIYSMYFRESTRYVQRKRLRAEP